MKQEDCFVNLGVDGTIILKYILKNMTGECCYVSQVEGGGQLASSCEYSHELQCCLKCRHFH